MQMCVCVLCVTCVCACAYSGRERWSSVFDLLKDSRQGAAHHQWKVMIQDEIGWVSGEQ